VRAKIKRAEIVATCGPTSQFPEATLPEVALLGRSNVGKSSLLNKLVQRRQLARTSSTPGKTRLIHFYEVEIGGDALRLVDLPGYGYARVSRSEREDWKRLVERYLDAREPLRAALLLQDLRRDASEDETLLLAWLEERGIDPLVAITKVDKLKRMQRQRRLRELRGQLALAPERAIATSAQTGEGIDALWRAIRARVAAPPQV